MPDTEPDNDKLDAWLAGELSPEESEAFEAEFENIQIDADPDGAMPADDLLLDLDRDRPQATRPGTALTELVEQVKTLSGDDLPSPAKDSWREVLTPAENPDFIGKLGDYEVIGAIATGGMATVLKARDSKLDRTVAVKVLPPELAANSTARARFLREARAAAQLEHENILPIHAVHEDDHAAFFAMRYIPTGSLQDALDSGESFDIDRLKSIGRGVAAALEAAHRAGIIHRDIKPANILLGENNGEVWVCDFGIARSTEDPSLTYTTSIAGTPQYMSPEQAAGEELDGRSDLFSLGSVLYRCATGKPAFGGTTTASVLQSLAASETIPATTITRKLPKWFSNLLANLLAKAPADRPRNAAATLRAIDDEHSPRPKSRQRRRRRLVAAAAVLLLGGFLLQVPAIRHQASRAISGVTGNTFLVDSRLGAYPTLQSAIRSARDGDTITLPAGNTIAVDGVGIPPGKRLTLRGTVGGEHPTLVTKIAGATGISSSAPVSFKHLAFRIQPVNEGSGIVKIIATRGHFDDCVFTTGKRTQRRGRYLQPRVIELQDGGSLEITNCNIDLENAIVISVIGTRGAESNDPPLSSLTLRDTRAAATFVVGTRDWSGARRQRIAINAERLHFTGGRIFKHNPDSPIPEIDFNLEACELALTYGFAWFQTDDAETVLARLKLKIDSSAFPAGGADMQISINPKRRVKSLVGLDRFDRSSGTYQGKIGTGGTVVIKETGERFADLRSAVAAARPGATMLLSGRLVCDELIINRSIPVNLEAAPGERPIISTGLKQKHALYLRGPCRVRGIRFESLSSAGDAWPIVGINGHNHEVLVEDCDFVSIPTPGATGGHRALGISDTPRAIVRRCTFRTPRGSAFHSGTRSDHVLFTECSFVARHVFDRRNITDPARRGIIRAERCVFFGDHLLRRTSHRRFDALGFEFEDCLFDIREGLIDLADIAAADLPELLSWHGKNNFHREGATALRTFELNGGADFVPVAAADFQALEELGVKTENIGIKFGVPFDRSRLREPITPKSLFDSLDPDIESPAITTLERIKNAPGPDRKPVSGFDWQKLDVFRDRR